MLTGQRKSVSFLFLWFAPSWYFHLQKVYVHRSTFTTRSPHYLKVFLDGSNFKKPHKWEMWIRQQYLLELPRTDPCAKSQLDFRPLIVETDGEMLSSLAVSFIILWPVSGWSRTTLTFQALPLVQKIWRHTLTTKATLLSLFSSPVPKQKRYRERAFKWSCRVVTLSASTTCL